MRAILATYFISTWYGCCLMIQYGNSIICCSQSIPNILLFSLNLLNSRPILNIVRSRGGPFSCAISSSSVLIVIVCNNSHFLRLMKYQKKKKENNSLPFFFSLIINQFLLVLIVSHFTSFRFRVFYTFFIFSFMARVSLLCGGITDHTDIAIFWPLLSLTFYHKGRFLNFINVFLTNFICVRIFTSESLFLVIQNYISIFNFFLLSKNNF